MNNDPETEALHAHLTSLRRRFYALAQITAQDAQEAGLGDIWPDLQRIMELEAQNRDEEAQMVMLQIERKLSRLPQDEPAGES